MTHDSVCTIECYKYEVSGWRSFLRILPTQFISTSLDHVSVSVGTCYFNNNIHSKNALDLLRSCDVALFFLHSRPLNELRISWRILYLKINYHHLTVSFFFFCIFCQNHLKLSNFWTGYYWPILFIVISLASSFPIICCCYSNIKMWFWLLMLTFKLCHTVY